MFVTVFVLTAAAAAGATIGITCLIIKYAPKGWRTRLSAMWMPILPLVLNMLDAVKDIDWNFFTERRGVAAGIGIGVSWSIILLKKATMKAVVEDLAAGKTVTV